MKSTVKKPLSPEKNRTTKSARSTVTPRKDGMIGLSNEFVESGDGWLRTAIYGESEHRATGRRIVQVFDREAANEIVRNFKAKAHELAGKVRGVFSRPLFVGHPDNAAWCAAKPWAVDSKAYGWIDDVQARDDGLYIKPRWSKPGEALLANSHYRFLSVHWLLRHIDGERYRPYWLESAGLTNQPNIVGDAIANEETRQSEIMNELLKKILVKLSLTDDQIEAIATNASDALTEEQILEMLDEMLQSKDEAEETLANERTRLAGIVADNAVFTGKCSFAEREALANELINDFESRFARLQRQPARIKTARLDADFSKSRRKQSKTDELLAAANEYIAEHQLDANSPVSLTRAFGALRRTRPEFFK